MCVALPARVGRLGPNRVRDRLGVCAMKAFLFVVDMLAFLTPALALDAVLANYFLHWVW